MVAHIHRGVRGCEEKADPPGVEAAQQTGLRTHHQCERFAVAEFVVAPALRPQKDRVKAQLRMLSKLVVDADIAGVANSL